MMYYFHLSLPEIFMHKSITWWAVSTVMTRQNLTPSENNPQDRVLTLIPFWDMCNHCDGTISTGYNVENQTSECRAMRDFKKDEQIFIFYGARTNLEFFIHNGFVYEDNRYDGYQITLGLSQSDHLWDRRNEIFELLEIRSTETFLIDLQERPIPDKMLAFCRIFSMGESDLEKWINSGKCNQLLEKECALETELNKKTWSFLQMRFKLLLSSFKTTPSEDEALCKDPNLSDNMKLAVKMRRAERKILLYNLKYVEDRLSTV